MDIKSKDLHEAHLCQAGGSEHHAIMQRLMHLCVRSVDAVIEGVNIFEALM
jgi:hypothetical protein